MAKPVVMLITKAPYGHENVYGALYTTITSQDIGLPATVILIGDGVYSALKGQLSEESIQYPSIENLFYMITSDTKILADEQSLAERKIPKENLIDTVKIVSEKEIFETILKGQAILTY